MQISRRPVIAGFRTGAFLATTLCLLSLASTVAEAQAYVYVTNEGDDNVSAYSIDPKTGVLTPVPGSPFAAGYQPFAVMVTPSHKFAYVANISDQTVSGYSIDP